MLRTVTHVSQLLKNKLEFGVHQPAGADRLSEEPSDFVILIILIALYSTESKTDRCDLIVRD